MARSHTRHSWRPSRPHTLSRVNPRVLSRVTAPPRRSPHNGSGHARSRAVTDVHVQGAVRNFQKYSQQCRSIDELYDRFLSVKVLLQQLRLQLNASIDVTIRYTRQDEQENKDPNVRDILSLWSNWRGRADTFEDHMKNMNDSLTTAFDRLNVSKAVRHLYPLLRVTATTRR